MSDKKYGLWMMCITCKLIHSWQSIVLDLYNSLVYPLTQLFLNYYIIMFAAYIIVKWIQTIVKKIKKNVIHWLYLLLRLTIAHPLKKVMASKIKLLARKSHFTNDLKQQSPGASLINSSTNIYWSQNFSHQATWVKCRFHNSVNIWSDKVYSIFKFISKLQTKSVWFFRV